MEDNKNNTIIDTDEILVKGTDGKWYILRGEELVPYEEKVGVRGQGSGVRELPKGVTVEVHKKFEQKIVPQIQSPIIQKTAPVVVSHEGHPLIKELEELIDQAVVESQKVVQVQIPPWDAVLQKRFRVLVSARLRDVRDALETKSLLTREIKIGGMGLKEADTQALSVIIEAKFKEFDQKWRAEEIKKRAEWQKKQASEAAQREKELVQKDEEELERRHRALVGKSGTREMGPVSISRPTLKEQTKISNTHPPAGGPISNKISNVPNVKKEIKKLETIKPAVAMPDSRRDSRSPAERQVTTSPLSLATRPKVVDVKFTPRLLSPVEELREMNLIDFRRLGRDAAEIMFKIKAKIDLLGEESFVKKTEGVAAWKQSEPAKLYTTLSTIALTSGQPVSAIIAEREKKGEKTLAVDEFRGIMELMKGLRF